MDLRYKALSLCHGVVEFELVNDEAIARGNGFKLRNSFPVSLKEVGKEPHLFVVVFAGL